MPRLLVIHHTPSPAMDTLLQAVLSGTRAPNDESLEIVTRAALQASASDVLESDGYILGTPANLGYMSGALKHFFDTIYYPCLEQTQKRPYGTYIHGNNDVDGALDSIDRIVTGLGWRLAQPAVRVVGDLTSDDRDACWELGAAVAAGLLM